MLSTPWGNEITKGYFDSIRQRLALLDAKVPALAKLVTWYDAGEELTLVSEVVKGEPFLQSLEREGSPGKWIYHSLILDLVVALRRLAVNERVFSCIRLDDFFVTRRSGGRLELEPVFALLRKEVSRSDADLAKRCYEAVARLLLAPKSGEPLSWDESLEELYADCGSGEDERAQLIEKGLRSNLV